MSERQVMTPLRICAFDDVEVTTAYDGPHATGIRWEWRGELGLALVSREVLESLLRAYDENLRTKLVDVEGGR